MSRFACFWTALVAAVLLLACGYLIPAHIRAVDASVLQAAGRGTPSLVKRAMDLVALEKLGSAQLLFQVAKAEGLSDRAVLSEATTDLARKQPELQFWGGPEPRIESIADPRRPKSESEAFTAFVVRQEHRQRVLDFLGNVRKSSVVELLNCRRLTNTVIFPPSWTSSGQAFDAAISVTGLLMAEERLNPSLESALYSMANAANRGGNPHQLEQALLDMMSLGQRLNWGQLVVFVQNIQDPETLRYLASLIRRSEGDLPIIYASVELSGDPKRVAAYAMNFGDTGIRDLRGAIRYNSGGLRVLLDRNQRLRHSPFDVLLTSYIPFDNLPVLVWRSPGAAIALKWLMYLGAGYLFALGVHFLLLHRTQMRVRAAHGEPIYELPPVRGIHVTREILCALGFLVVMLLVSEPFLSQDSQKVDFPFRLRLALTTNPAPATLAVTKSTIMNQLSLLTLLLFFVLQALIYTACMFKLAEVRRQNISPRIKLRLLDNEDHLFDAGLYLGFVGTIISLILVSLGVIKPSLMAAYSSTSFGIIFVSIFKIFNLRPYKRRLVLESELTTEAELERPGAMS